MCVVNFSSDYILNRPETRRISEMSIGVTAKGNNSAFGAELTEIGLPLKNLLRLMQATIIMLPLLMS